MMDSIKEIDEARLESIDKSLAEIANCLRDIRDAVIPNKAPVFDDENIDSPWLNTIIGPGYLGMMKENEDNE
jgi:hypothetical protein